MRTLGKSTYSPALPPCDQSPEGIKALYTGRFIVMPLKDLKTVASRVFPDLEETERRLQAIFEASRGGVGRQRLSEALDDYLRLLLASGSIEEEAEHHSDLVKTPLWVLINGSALCERLHLIHAQFFFDKKLIGKSLSRTLGRAFGLHLFRRYLYSQMWPLVEVLFFLPKLASPKPISALNDFEINYGEEAGIVAEALWTTRIENANNRIGELKECQALLLKALDYRIIAPDGWLPLLDRTLGLVRNGPRPSFLAKHFLDMLGDGEITLASTPSLRMNLPSFILGYLWHIKETGLLWTLTRLATGAFGASILPLAKRLLRKDPYVTEDAKHGTAPGLRVYIGDGELIIDPPAMTRFSSSLNHRGMENSMTQLSDSGYAADQFVLRRVSETMMDPDHIWTPRLENFIRRWADLNTEDWANLQELLAKIEPLVTKIANKILMSVEVEISSQYLYGEVIDLHVEARRILLQHLTRDIAAGRRTSPVKVLLHAYYIHGL